jgi:hypothetical protein
MENVGKADPSGVEAPVYGKNKGFNGTSEAVP